MTSSATEKIRAVPETGSELVSAVIPTCKLPALVVQAVRSALQQTYSRIEVVVVIDGPDPETEASLAQIHDLRLRVLPLAINVGGAEARNIGVRAARGRWIAFLDDDDEWLPGKIALQLAAAQSSETALPIISAKLIARASFGSRVQPRRSYRAGQPLSEHLFCRSSLTDGPYALQTSTLFIPRALLLAAPFRAGLKRHQDWDWLLRISSHPGVRFCVLPEPLVIFRADDSHRSISRGLDWEFSLHWATSMRSRFTSRAYSFFVATECIPRAVKSRAGLSVYSRLVREAVFQGSPTIRSLAWLAGFLSIPQTLRTCLLQHLRRAISVRSATRKASGASRALSPVADPNLTI